MFAISGLQEYISKHILLISMCVVLVLVFIYFLIGSRKKTRLIAAVLTHCLGIINFRRLSLGRSLSLLIVGSISLLTSRQLFVLISKHQYDDRLCSYINLLFG